MENEVRKLLAQAKLLLLEADLKKWFSKSNSKGDWVAIDTQGKIVGPCAQSKDRKKETKKGKKPLKCMPRSKAHSMIKEERATSARRKKREQKGKRTGKKPVWVKTLPEITP